MAALGVIIIVIVGYTPIIYRINKRLKYLENQVESLKRGEQ